MSESRFSFSTVWREDEILVGTIHLILFHHTLHSSDQITYQCSCFYGYIASFALLRHRHCQTCCCGGVTAHEHSSRRYSSSSPQQLTLSTRGRGSRVLVWLLVATSFEAFLSLSKVVVRVMWRIYELSEIYAHCRTYMHTNI